MMLRKLLYRMAVQIARGLDAVGVFRLLAFLLRFTVKEGIGTDSFLKEGFLPVPVHFYSPIPDIKDLEERRVWDQVSSMTGIAFSDDRQLDFLSRIGGEFGEECSWPATSEDPFTFFTDNVSFSFGCAASTHCMIRSFKPSRVFEVGSGMSTRVIRSALQTNERETNLKSIYRVIDPYPSEITRMIVGDNLVVSRVELLSVDFFAELQDGDVLFIDSSHSVKIGSDVNYLVLEILPRLTPGVVVHIHDISLPFEYAKIYATNPSFRQFWTEQYLLQAFLCHNSKFDVLIGMHYLMTQFPEAVGRAFPAYDPDSPRVSGSFWMRSVTG